MKANVFSKVLVFLSVVVYPAAQAQGFRVQGTEVLDPGGKPFIVKGVNVNGPHWPWSRPTAPDADLIADTWKFNTVRINCVPSLAANGCCVSNNTNLDQIVTAFTSRKVVAMLENHDFTCTYPDATQLATLKSWWVDLAIRYKNNPYVWFNILNEPGGGDTVDERWKTVHEEVVKAIRLTGANNIIVLDGFACGQEKGFSKGESGSGILSYGPYLAQTYVNITFSLHLYGEWIYGRQRLSNYLDAVRAKGLSIHIGEYGTAVDYSKAVAADVLHVCLQKNVGRMAWQWTGVDVHRLTQNSGGFAIDRTDGGKPGNLSFAGNLIWKDNRNELTAGSPDFNVPAPWLLNGGFEDGDFPDGWQNFGGSAAETAAANVRSGRRSLRVNAGSASGAGQALYLLADTTYILTAWGRNAAVPAAASSMGLNIKAAGQTDRTVSVNFNETAFTQKSLRFRTPAQPTETYLFIYKNDAGAVFYVDDVDVQLESMVTAVELPAMGQALDMYPNPCDGTLTIAFRQPTFHQAVREVNVSDLAGRGFATVPFRHWEKGITLDTRMLENGFYLLRIKLNDRWHTAKLLVQR